MKEDYFEIGNLVTVKRWDGATGEQLRKHYNEFTVFEIMSIQEHNTSVEEYHAWIRPVNPADYARTTIVCWDRLKSVVVAIQTEYEDALEAQEAYTALVDGGG